jgi:hypothetical protein
MRSAELFLHDGLGRRNVRNGALRQRLWSDFSLYTVKVGLKQGSTQIAFDLVANLRSDFRPDVKNKILCHKP